MDSKFTKSGFYAAVIAKMNGEPAEEIWTDEAVAEFAAERMEAERKREKERIENIELKTEIVALLSDTAKVASVVADELGISVYKASGLLVALENEGVVRSTEIKVNKRKVKGYFI